MEAEIKEIKEIIKKNLPAHVGDALRERLEQADRDKRELENTKALVKDRNAVITRLEEQVNELSKRVIAKETLEADRKAFEVEKRDFQVEQLKYQLNTEKEKSSFCMDVTKALVRNTEYRKSIYDSESQPGFTDQNGNWRQPGNVIKTLDEKHTAD